MCAKSLQSCLDLATPWTVALQARILEWVARPSSRGSSRLRIELASPALAGGLLTTRTNWKPLLRVHLSNSQ